MRLTLLALPVTVLGLAACQPSAADRDTSPAAPAPTAAKTIERAAPEAVSPELSVHNVVYRCTDGRTVAARYDGERAFLSLDGRSLTLTTHPSASGARYVGGGVQWWTRGMDRGRLSALADGETYAEADAGVDCAVATPSVTSPPAEG